MKLHQETARLRDRPSRRRFGAIRIRTPTPPPRPPTQPARARCAHATCTPSPQPRRASATTTWWPGAGNRTIRRHPHASAIRPAGALPGSGWASPARRIRGRQRGQASGPVRRPLGKNHCRGGRAAPWPGPGVGRGRWHGAGRCARCAGPWPAGARLAQRPRGTSPREPGRAGGGAGTGSMPQPPRPS